MFAGMAAMLLLGTAACGRPSRAAEAPTTGAQLFDRACAKCHGHDGSGGLPMAAGGPRPIDLRRADWQASRTDEEITSAIRDGRGAMPAFADVLSPADTATLARYVRGLAARPAP